MVSAGRLILYIVIFEVWTSTDRQDEYLSLAAALKAELMEQPGFISVERFASLYDEGKLLSLSRWESEEAIAGWKSNSNHMQAQERGKSSVFKKYRISVARVERDYEVHCS